MDTDSLQRRLKAGDESAMRELVDLCFDPLVLYLNRYLHCMQEAEDAASDAFYALLLHPDRIRPDSSVKAYLFTIGRNGALNRLRHNKALRVGQIGENEEELADERSLEEDVIRAEETRAVWKAISSLPDEMREAVHLVCIERMSYKDAGRVMKKSAKQIDNLLTRARSLLRGELGKKGISI